MSKFCGKCGTKLSENEKFCSKCGAPTEVSTNISSNNVPKQKKSKKIKKEKKTMSKGKKAKIIIITILAILLVLTATIATVFFTGSSFKVFGLMNKENYKEAVSTYSSEVSDDFIQKTMLKVALNNYDEKLSNRFTKGKISYDSAVEGLKALNEMSLGDFTNVIEEITRINDSNTAFDKALQFYNNGDYENAIIEFSKILEGNERYDEAQAKLNEIYPKYISEITRRVNELSNEKDYEKAITLINTALEILPQSIDATELKQLKASNQTEYKSSTIAEVTELVNQKDYLKALETINHAITIDDNEEFGTTKSTVETKYVESVTKTVQAYLNSEDFDSAERTIKSALETLPDNTNLKNLQQKVKDETPIYLLDVCKPYQTTEGYEEFVNGETFTVGGTEQTNGFKIPSSGGTVIFNVEAKYKTLGFSLGHVADTNFDNAKIKVYLDGKHHKTYDMSYQDLAKRISIDITGVKQIKFVVEAYEDQGSYWVSYGFGNITVM